MHKTCWPDAHTEGIVYMGIVLKTIRLFIDSVQK